MTTAPAVRPSAPGVDTERFERDGYLVLEKVLAADEVAALNDELVRLVRGELGPVHGSTVGPEATAEQALAATLCVHFPHKLSPSYEAAMRHPRILAALVALLSPDLKCMQSMAFVKSEGKPGQAWHQDEQFIPTRDRSLTAAWIALDDATVHNGCLWALPGSHRPGVLYPLREQQDERFDCSQEAYRFPYRDEDAVALEVQAGDVVLFDGYLLHRSLPNTGGHGLRRALVHHYMNAASLLPWTPQDDVPIAMTDFRDVVLVAGTDPYAWQPAVELSRVEVRPDGRGGCRPPQTSSALRDEHDRDGRAEDHHGGPQGRGRDATGHDDAERPAQQRGHREDAGQSPLDRAGEGEDRHAHDVDDE